MNIIAIIFALKCFIKYSWNFATTFLYPLLKDILQYSCNANDYKNIADIFLKRQYKIQRILQKFAYFYKNLNKYLILFIVLIKIKL